MLGLLILMFYIFFRLGNYYSYFIYLFKNVVKSVFKNGLRNVSGGKKVNFFFEWIDLEL